MSSESKKARKGSGAPKRAEPTPESLVEPPPDRAAEAEAEAEAGAPAPAPTSTPTPDLADAERNERAEKKARLARVKARYQTGASKAAVPVNVVDSASADAHGFPALVGFVHSAKVNVRDPQKCDVDLIVSRIVAPAHTSLVARDFFHAVYTQKPAVDPSAPPKPKAAGQMSEKHDRIINETPLFHEITSHAHVSYSIKNDGTNPPPPVGACVRFLNVEPKRGMKPGTETEVYLNCTKSFVVVGQPRLPHSAAAEYLSSLQNDPRIAGALARDLLKAAGGAAQFVRMSEAGDDSSLSAGENAILSHESAAEKERVQVSARLAHIADHLPPKEPNRDTKSAGLHAVAKRLVAERDYALPTSESARTISSFVIVQRGGRGGGHFDGSSLVDVEEDPRIVNMFDEDEAAGVPPTFAKMELAYKPTVHGKLFTAHFRLEAVLDKAVPPEGELGDDSTGIIKSVAEAGSAALTPTCGFKMTTAVAGTTLGILSKVHLHAIVDKYIQHIPFAALVKAGDRQPFAADEPIDVDWVKGWVPDMPSFLIEMGVRVGEEWALKNVANGRANFPAMRLTTEGAQANSFPLPLGHTRPHITTHGYANLLEADGAAPEDLKAAAYDGVAVRYYMLPFGATAPASTPPIGTSRADGEAYMSKLIAESGKEPRAFFEEGMCLPFAVLVAKPVAA